MKTALVTGAARRFGAHMVERLAREGYRVLMVVRGGMSEAQELAARLEDAHGVSIELLQSEIGASTTAAMIADWAASKIGDHGLDLLVLNASSYLQTPIGAPQAGVVSALIESNITGPFYLTSRLLPLLNMSRGCVVGICDAADNQARPSYSMYSATKAAMRALFDTLAVEAAPVRFNTVSPGIMPFPEHYASGIREHLATQIPLGRIGAWEDMAAAVMYLAHADYVSGADIRVDGAWSRVGGRTLG